MWCQVEVGFLHIWGEVILLRSDVSYIAARHLKRELLCHLNSDLSIFRTDLNILVISIRMHTFLFIFYFFSTFLLMSPCECNLRGRQEHPGCFRGLVWSRFLNSDIKIQRRRLSRSLSLSLSWLVYLWEPNLHIQLWMGARWSCHYVENRSNTAFTGTWQVLLLQTLTVSDLCWRRWERR